MAVRIRTGFHTQGKARSMTELASVVGAMAWKLAIDSMKRMRDAGYDIDIGPAYFNFVCEYMVFLATAADRIAHADLSSEERVEFTTALVKRMAELVEDNREMRIEVLSPGESRRWFFDLFNRRGDDYAECGFDETEGSGPDFGFRRVFAAGMQEVLPEKDRLWAIDQVMEIESPEVVRALRKTLGGLFHPEAAKSRRSQDGVGGE